MISRITSHFTLLLCLACNSPEGNTSTSLTLGDLTELDKVESVEMSNNSGTFQLSPDQILQLKNELKAMVYDPSITVKVGAINIGLEIEGKQHHISTATHGDFIEVHRDLVTMDIDKIGESEWLYFRTNGVNFDNYKEEIR